MVPERGAHSPTGVRRLVVMQQMIAPELVPRPPDPVIVAELPKVMNAVMNIIGIVDKIVRTMMTMIVQRVAMYIALL